MQNKCRQHLQSKEILEMRNWHLLYSAERHGNNQFPDRVYKQERKLNTKPIQCDGPFLKSQVLSKLEGDI